MCNNFNVFSVCDLHFVNQVFFLGAGIDTLKDAMVVPGTLGSSFSRNHCASTFGHQPSSAGGCSGVQISNSKFWSEAGSAARNFWYQCRTAANPGGPGTTSSCNHTINAGREELAQRYRDEARQRAEQALRLPGGISRNALTPSAVPVIGHAILSTLTRAPSKRTSENSTSLRLLALMRGFGRVAGLTRAGELLALRQHMKSKGPQANRQDDRKLAIASLIWNNSHLIWLSFLSWLLVQLQTKSVKGILFMSYVEFDESSSNLKVAEWKQELGEPVEEGNAQGKGTTSKGKETVKVFCARQHFSFVVHGKLTGN